MTALSAQSIFFLWVSLEINIIAALPLLSSKNSLFSSEVRLKYFISQRVASILFLVTYLRLRIFLSFFTLTIRGLFILFKLGLPPFHRWLSRIVIIRPYKQLWLILFVQKFIPLQFLTRLRISTINFLTAIFLTIMVCFSHLKNIRRIRLMLLISAWVNTVWVLASFRRSNNWALFLLIYGWILLVVLNFLQNFSINKISSIMKLNIVDKLSCSLSFLNLAGLPPLSGFFIKLFVLKFIILNNSIILSLSLLFLSLMVLYAYTSIFYYFISSFTSISKIRDYLSIGLNPLRIYSRWVFLPILFIFLC